MTTRRSYRWVHSRDTVDLRKLREILMTRCGEQAAIRARDLVVLLGLRHGDRYSERSIRKSIDVLIQEGLAIGSTVTEPAGYYLISAEWELQKCVANYRSQARAIEAEAVALIDAFRRGPVQPSLGL